jgi:hypothetical protein
MRAAVGVAQTRELQLGRHGSQRQNLGLTRTNQNQLAPNHEQHRNTDTLCNLCIVPCSSAAQYNCRTKCTHLLGGGSIDHHLDSSTKEHHSCKVIQFGIVHCVATSHFAQSLQDARCNGSAGYSDSGLNRLISAAQSTPSVVPFSLPTKPPSCYSRPTDRTVKARLR